MKSKAPRFMVALAKEVFDRHMPAANQVDRLRDDVAVGAADLVAVPAGSITEEGLRHNIRVGVQYIEAWLGGNGCVPLYNLMEDAATAEICRSQVWQWLKHGARLDDGRRIDVPLVRTLIDEEMATLRQTLGGERFAAGRFADAVEVFIGVATAPDFVDFLTLPAYQRVLSFAG
jgi:malate synthase